jgi:hypothetical protein
VLFGCFKSRYAPFVNCEGPATVSTIIRKSWRKDSVAESPMYRTRPVGSGCRWISSVPVTCKVCLLRLNTLQHPALTVYHRFFVRSAVDSGGP